jgi:DNA-binding transcriptional ArsR family regulator
MVVHVDVAAAAELIGHPARAAMLGALMDDRGLPATELAAAAGVTAPTASSHLARLLDGGLLTVERHGRHRYYRLAGHAVAEAVEALARIAPPGPSPAPAAESSAGSCAPRVPATTTWPASWASLWRTRSRAMEPSSAGTARSR